MAPTLVADPPTLRTPQHPCAGNPICIGLLKKITSKRGCHWPGDTPHNTAGCNIADRLPQQTMSPGALQHREALRWTRTTCPCPVHGTGVRRRQPLVLLHPERSQGSANSKAHELTPSSAASGPYAAREPQEPLAWPSQRLRAADASDSRGKAHNSGLQPISLCPRHSWPTLNTCPADMRRLTLWPTLTLTSSKTHQSAGPLKAPRNAPAFTGKTHKAQVSPRRAPRNTSSPHRAKTHRPPQGKCS